MNNTEIIINSQEKDLLIEVLNDLRKENISGYHNVVSAHILRKLKGEVEKTCRFGHECTSACGNDYDCPCQHDHTCDLSN